MKIRWQTVALGIAFGIISPIVGVFIGLQVSVVLGTILTFPVLMVVYVTGTPLGMLSWWLILVGALVSVVTWTLLFALIDLGLTRLRK